MKERRRYKRIPIELVVSCYLPTKQDGKEEKVKSYAKDISPKGIKLVLPGRVKVGDEIIVLLEKPITLMPILAPLMIKGKVRWMKKLDEPPRNKEEAVQIGVEFIHVSAYGSKRLDNLIKEVEANNRLNKSS